MGRFVHPLASTLLCGLAGQAAAEVGSAASVAGVEKVIQMLTDMTAKGMQEKKDEQVAFAEFKTWCTQEKADLTSQIKKGAEEIEMLTASIGQLGSDITTLSDNIAQLQADETKFTSERAASKAQREKDHAEFKAEEQDFSESVDAIERALNILSKQDYDRPAAAAALVQVSSSQQMPEKARSIVNAFVGLLDDKPGLGAMDYSAPEANAYEFQSGGIITILKKLRDEFRSQLSQSQKEEMNSQHASDMIVNDLTDSIENAQKDIERRTIKKQQKIEKKAQEEKRRKGTVAVKAADEKTLGETKTECHEKTYSFEEKQKLRAEEIEALQKATEILSSPDVLGSAEKHLSLAQTPSSIRALLQTSGGSEGQGVHRRVRDFLAAEGSRLHSQSLTLLAERITADPFAKVKKMIDGMITRLLEEANEDAKHEGFCDTEMGKNKVTRNKLSSDIDALSASIEDGKATVMSLTEENAQLAADLNELEKSMAEATALRQKEKNTNAATVKDAQAAQAAVAAATAVLKDYYAKAATATAFVQVEPRQWGLKTGVKMGTDEWDALANPNFKGEIDKGHKEGMQTFGEREEGQQEEAQYGVLGLLEVIASDFATLEANTNAAEAAAAEAYERFMVDSNKSKAVKNRKSEMNEMDRASTEARVQEETADLKSTQDQLLAADRYHERLVPQCIDQGMTWDQRVAARQAEIDSLKQAVTILSSSDVA